MIVLTVTMIAGFLTIVMLFIVKFRSFGGPPVLMLPDHVTLPEGQYASGFVHGNDLFYVITRDDAILVYDAQTGTIVKQVEIR